MAEIIPAIIPKDFSELAPKIELVKGLVDTVQIDICDGRFAGNRTWPYQGDADIFHRLVAEDEGLRFWGDVDVDFEFDLMVSHPSDVIADWVKAGASRVYVHIESIKPDELSDLIHEWKSAVEIGLALKPSPPLSVLEPFLHEVSSVQCMGNDKISFGGVPLDEEKVLPKIAELRKKHPALAISVDIGVNLETAPRLITAGATRLVAGSAIFGAPDAKDAIAQFKGLV